MGYFLSLGLTILFVSYILIKRKKSPLTKLRYSQSSIFYVIKDYIPKNMFEKKRMITQSINHMEKNTIKVFFVDDKAYWVKNNMFFYADAPGGVVDIETASPVNTESMSKYDIDKMLFILDNLKNRDINDSGSTGN